MVEYLDSTKIQYNAEGGAMYEYEETTVPMTEENEENDAKIDDIRAKSLQASGESLEEMLIRFDKTLKRHERDLVKLKPVTLQAPDAANNQANLLTCLADYVGSRIRNAMKSLFVTRNEFKELENMLPDTTAHANDALKKMTQKF